MARRSNNELQRKWEDRIRKAKAEREEWATQFRIEKARDFIEGKQNPGVNDRDWITINKLYAHMEVQLPTLYAVDPYFYVKVRRSYSPNPMDVALFEQRGKMRQAYLNWLKAELDLKSKARLAIQDAFSSYGVLKTHYHVKLADNPDAGKAVTGEDGEELLDDEGVPLREPEQMPIHERYKLTRVHPDDLLWDEHAGPLEDDWHWLAQRIRMTRAEALADPRIKNAALKTAERKPREDDEGGRSTAFDTSPQLHKGDGEDDGQVYVLWEIYDLKEEQWLMIAEDAERPVMMPEELPPGIESHPYEILRFTMRHNSPYPVPPLSQAIDPQIEYCNARSQIQTHRKRFNRKYEMNTTVFDDPDVVAAQLESGGDGTVLQKNTHMPGVTPIADAQMDPMTYQELGALNQDFVEILGSPDAAQIARSESATEASLLDKRLEVREGDRLSIVVDWVSLVARKLDQLVQAHITRDEAVKVTGPQGEMWELVKADDYESIEGEFDYSVNTGATVPRLPQVERSQWLAFLQVLGGFPHLMTSPSLMKRMAEMHHIEDEQLVQELMKIGQQILSQQVPPPGASGSGGTAPGEATNNPITQVLGAALGDQGGVAGQPGPQAEAA